MGLPFCMPEILIKHFPALSYHKINTNLFQLPRCPVSPLHSPLALHHPYRCGHLLDGLQSAPQPEFHVHLQVSRHNRQVQV